MVVGRALANDLAILYTPCAVGRREAANRWVSQPMEACDAEPNGAPSEQTHQRYERLAEGGWGIVVVEATSVTTRALGRLRGLILNQETAAGHAELVRRFKARNPRALLWLQLTHSGPNSHPSTDPTTVSPAPQPGLRYLSTEEIEVIRQQAVETTLLAEQVGYDGIDIKSCNGYLGADLLRPANTRADRWGGSLKNRMHFFVEAFQEIQARRRSNAFVLGMRIHWAERRVGGLGAAGPASAAYDPAETLELIRLLGRLGLDYVNITGQVTDLSGYGDMAPEERRVPALLAERLATELVHAEGLGLAVIGSSYSELGQDMPAVAAARIRAGHTDFVGLGRGSLSDPCLPVHVHDGGPARFCVDCGGCVRLMLAQMPSGCVTRDPYYRDLYRELRRGAS